MTIACNTLNPETFLELISSKGRESFYEEFGFEQRPCDGDGAGMFKMVRK